MNTVRSRVLCALFAASLLPLVVVFFVVNFHMSHALHESSERKLSETTRELSKHVSVIMQGAKRDLNSLQTNPILTDPGSSEASQLEEMQRLVEAYDSYSDISLYDANGFLINSTTTSVPIWKEYTTWFQTAISERTNTISDPLPMNGKPGLHLSVYLPLINSDGSVRNVIVARLSFARVSDMLNSVRVGEEGFIVLINHLGNAIVDGSQTRGQSTLKKDRELIDWVENPKGEYVSLDGKTYLYESILLTSSETAVDKPWVLVALKPIEEVAAIANRTKLFLLATFGVSIVFAAYVGYWMANSVSKPLDQAGRAAEQVAEGDLDVRLPESIGTTELRKLSLSFNQMVEEVASNRTALEKKVDERTSDLRESRGEVERSASQLRAAFNATQEGILVTAEDGSIVAVNGPFYKAMGLDPSIPLVDRKTLEKQLEGVLDPEVLSAEEAILTLTQNAIETIETEWQVSKDITDVVEIYSAPIYSSSNETLGRITVVHDLRERRELEEGLRQAQKMEAVGQMAGGVAHDFNNLLTGVLGNLSLVEMDLDSETNATAVEHLGQAQKAGSRAADLVKKLLGFSRRSHMNLDACDVNDIVGEAHSLLTTTIDPKIELKFNSQTDLWGIVADGTLLNQVIMNLAGNARDAMPDHGGSITVTTKNCSVTPEYVVNTPDARAGDHVCITVEDNGTGMSKEVMAHVFEPFFTTKEQGKGTGLGLATSFGIIKQLGGWITLDSVEGVGTRFDIFIPRSVAAESQSQALEPVKVAKADSSAVGEGRGSETVLLVDDEFMVRKVAQTMLEKLGYHVLLASNGEEALQIYSHKKDEIDLVMLDLTMPTLSGKETFKRLRSQFAYVPVMICSGYLLDLTEFEEETGGAPDGFVQKPYRFEMLANTLREVLDSSPVAA